ncbi:anthranilate phosphoribosyltransferase [Methyloversatilis sp.]|uniref:anthranilate phosphoribosyltransferase n=1 Tax=Methyloversatilis sp. TaxID=2569862 RepID=UPI0027369262|nr:anthranilate phosphoribosyltransferase [Methyloversatilis sp.]MDP2870342.1 anthranilate phosphoribosyltransferase [Methyloversatilis sp.]MDP3288185.1 anthranilate phosphoribosyltransferase [Methyloversatilis sp.]MDP3455766.1 anthranilate phosphoribosyltransferase [Methyloversatilis sp.]MDP3577910.1 anthranilate phosphoribosyltransferase [Methyloversatilis sp.]
MTFTPKQALERVIEHREIFRDEMTALMRQIMTGEVSPTLIAAILIGLRVKKETVGEIAAAALVMRELSMKVPVDNSQTLVDTCGTGGDGAHTFNISTAAMFVAAAAGARVAKHGGRASSSQSGSADVLEALGVTLNLTPAQVATCVEQAGVGFMFAPNHHSAMKHAAPVRRELGVRTMFNILGPLTNPAGAANQVMGVFHADLVGILARVLKELGSRNVMVVHGRDGLDELTISGDTFVGELRDGAVREYTVHPSDVGLPVHALDTLRVADVQASRDMLLAALDGSFAPARDVVLLNAGASLYVAGVADSLRDGVDRARTAVDSGAARARLDTLVELTRSFAT